MIANVKKKNIKAFNQRMNLVGFFACEGNEKREIYNIGVTTVIVKPGAAFL